MIKMNLYNKISQKQREDLKEADIIILEGKDYTKEETNIMYNTLTSHIFSKSKKDIPNEIGKFRDVLEFIKI